MRPLGLFLLALSDLSMAGCNHPGEAPAGLKSPDGSRIATIVNVANGGSGSAANYTAVALNLANRDSHFAINVLIIAVPDANPNHVAVRWADNKTLVLTVQNAQVDFQVVRCLGVAVVTQTAPSIGQKPAP